MHTLYNLLSGPLVWIALTVFIAGSGYKIIRMLVDVYQNEKFIFSFMNLKYSLRSILHWLTPFGSANMRLHPVMTVVTFAFHICLIIAPVFLLAHIVLLNQAWSIAYGALPDAVADWMTLVVIAACLFFFIRRLKSPEVQYVTTRSDYGLLFLVAAPFISGFWAYHQLPGYRYAMILHMLTGEIMLMAIPWTRLNHMLFSLFTRAYMGSEFGGVRHARDW